MCFCRNNELRHFSHLQTWNVAVSHLSPSPTFPLGKECNITAVVLLLGHDRHDSCVEFDYGTWLIWGTCMRHGILFSGFWGTNTLWHESRYQTLRWCELLGISRSQGSLKLPDYPEMRWVWFCFWSHQVLPVLMRNVLGHSVFIEWFAILLSMCHLRAECWEKGM